MGPVSTWQQPRHTSDKGMTPAWDDMPTWDDTLAGEGINAPGGTTALAGDNIPAGEATTTTAGERQ
jgi:hypothetical protein